MPISYDLTHHATMNQYEDLIAELQRFKARRVQLSEWMWRGSSNPVQLRDHLRPFIHQQDRLLITEVADWAAWNAQTNINQI